MSTDIRKPPTQESADFRSMIDHVFKGKPLDPEVAQRVHQRAEKIREELRKKGPTNVAVELIREGRDG